MLSKLAPFVLPWLIWSPFGLMHFFDAGEPYSFRSLSPAIALAASLAWMWFRQESLAKRLDRLASGERTSEAAPI